MMVLNQSFRDPGLVEKVCQKLKTITTQNWVIMEICGGQTHAILRNGLDQLIPEEIELVHGPGCPVCVTPLEQIDRAIEIANQPNVIFTSYGDMLRVPGSQTDLFTMRARGSDVRVVYSPLDAVEIAKNNPDKEVVFFAIGFETTAPPNAMSVVHAESLGLKNYSILVSHVRVPPAMRAILSSPSNRVQGFLSAGHVCAVMGYHEYIPIAKEFKVPIVVTGFEPVDILTGILKTVIQLEAGTHEVQNAYSRVVTQEGNLPAQEVIHQVFKESDRKWRGIGTIPMSGWKLNSTYAKFDAEYRYSVSDINTKEPEICIAGSILQGIRKPIDCEAFGKECTPETPLGATMVSSEGACSAYYQFKKD